MKRTLTHLEWVILCGTTALLLTACNGQKTLTEAAREMTADYHLSKAEQEIVDKENRFALHLFQRMAANKANRNSVYAPLGAAISAQHDCQRSKRREPRRNLQVARNQRKTDRSA